MKKRILSFMLVLCLLLGLLPMAALAADGTALTVDFNKISINESYIKTARVVGGTVTEATRLEAEPEAGESGRIHIQAELGRQVQDGDVISVTMDMSKGSASNLGFGLQPSILPGGLSVSSDTYVLDYETTITNGTGRIICYSYYNFTKYTTLIIDFFVGDQDAAWEYQELCPVNDAVLQQIRVWNQPVLKSYFESTGTVDSIPNTAGPAHGLVGYVWLEESVPDDAVIGIELIRSNSNVLSYPVDWTANGGYVQLKDGKATVSFNLQGLSPGPVGHNCRVTLYIQNYLSNAPTLAEGVTGNVELQTEVGVPYMVDFRDYFVDLNGEELIYHVSVDGKEAVSQSSYKYRYTPAQTGERTLVVTASDGVAMSEACTIVLRASEEHVWGDWTVTKAATCTEDGSRIHSCICCYTKETETIAAAGHTWDEWIVKTNANCVAEGVKLHTCTACGAVERETIPAGEHDWVVTSTATCGKAGVETSTCSGCGETKTANAPATGEHTWGKWTQTTDPTCAQAGEQTRTCGVCGQSETETVAATGNHTWGVWYQTTAPSCVDGERTRTCTGCDETQTAPIAANGQHNWGEWQITVTPTLSKPGKQTRVCGGCGETEEKIAYYKTPCVYINYSNAGTNVLAMAEVPLEDCNGTEGITLDDVLLMANMIYAPNGALDYDSGKEFVNEFWGISGAFGYTINHEFAWDIHETVEEGDVIDFYIYADPFNYSDHYGYFDQTMLDIKAGESVTLTCYQIPNSLTGNFATRPTSNAQITINGEKTDYYTDANGQVTITLDKGGYYEISAVTNLYVLVPPICVVNVDANQTKLDAPVLTEASVTATTITVTPPESSLIDPAATVEYSMYTGSAWSPWQTDPVFTKLANATEYQIRARYVTSDMTKFIDSDVSKTLTVTTAAGPAAVYTFGDVTAQPGQIIQIPVRLLCEAEDVWKWNVKLEYDTEALTLLSVEPGKDADGWTVKLNHVTHCVNGQLPMGQGVDSINGEMFLLNLQVKETAEPGDYSVTLGETWNVAGQNAFWNANRAYVTVTGQVNDACITVSGSPAAEPAAAFDDVSGGAWYYEPVQYMALTGLMQGTGADTFSPAMTTSRAMLVTLLYRMEGEPETDGVQPFRDVKADSYYADAVAWAAANGIVKGVSDTAFAPDAPVTREQTATILYRYAQWHGQPVGAADLNGFADADAVSAYAAEAMRWAVAEGILQGSGNQLDPTGSTTRAQLATILNRYLSE